MKKITAVWSLRDSVNLCEARILILAYVAKFLSSEKSIGLFLPPCIYIPDSHSLNEISQAKG